MQELWTGLLLEAYQNVPDCVVTHNSLLSRRCRRFDEPAHPHTQAVRSLLHSQAASLHITHDQQLAESRVVQGPNPVSQRGTHRDWLLLPLQASVCESDNAFTTVNTHSLPKLICVLPHLTDKTALHPSFASTRHAETC
jgi:hypothetical protein